MGGQLLHLRGLNATYEEVFLPLYGGHQAGNAATALAAVEALSTAAEPLGQELIRQAFGQVTSPGRLEVVRRGPTVLVDASHNPGAWWRPSTRWVSRSGSPG